MSTPQLNHQMQLSRAQEALTTALPQLQKAVQVFTQTLFTSAITTLTPIPQQQAEWLIQDYLLAAPTLFPLDTIATSVSKYMETINTVITTIPALTNNLEFPSSIKDENKQTLLPLADVKKIHNQADDATLVKLRDLYIATSAAHNKNKANLTILPTFKKTDVSNPSSYASALFSTIIDGPAKAKQQQIASEARTAMENSADPKDRYLLALTDTLTNLNQKPQWQQQQNRQQRRQQQSREKQQQQQPTPISPDASRPSSPKSNQNYKQNRNERPVNKTLKTTADLPFTPSPQNKDGRKVIPIGIYRAFGVKAFNYKASNNTIYHFTWNPNTHRYDSVVANKQDYPNSPIKTIAPALN